MTKDAYYKIGFFILALCIITWMFLPNSWGAESKERRSRDNLAGRLVDRDGDGYVNLQRITNGGALWKTEPAAGMKSKARLSAAILAVEPPMRLFKGK